VVSRSNLSRASGSSGQGTMNLGSWIWPVALAPIVGSFLGAAVTRFDEPSSLIVGRSRCDSCGVPLAPHELVPVVSWIASRGRCRHCAKPIGIFYPIIELSAAAVALWAATVFSGSLLWLSCVLGWTLLALAVIDYKHFLLPDFLTLPLIPVGLLVTWATDPTALLDHFAGVVVGFGVIVVLREVYRWCRGREGIGLGDAKLLAASGAFVSWQALPSVILMASLTALGVALLWKLHATNISLADRIPFGTFLCLATWIAWLYGPLTVG
jgi:leader peptidase (prepilin peptidase) / N-methyltransferase